MFGAATQPGVTVCVPSLPQRADMLARALRSVATQTLTPDSVVVVVDHARRGAARTRNIALEACLTEWVAFLDDDDELLPCHLAVLCAAAETSGADLIYPRFQSIMGNPCDAELERQGVPGGGFGRPFDDTLRDLIVDVRANFIPVTVLARRNVVEAAGGFPIPGTNQWPGKANEEWGLWRRMLLGGARFHHADHVTWEWHVHGGNTSGRGL